MAKSTRGGISILWMSAGILLIAPASADDNVEIVQVPSALKPDPPSAVCDDEEMKDVRLMCGLSSEYETSFEYLVAAREASDASNRLLGDGSELLRLMESDLDQIAASTRFGSRQSVHQFREAFRVLGQADAWDVLAFRETWTDEDTKLLQFLDAEAGSWVDGALTTEEYASQLPPKDELKALIEKRRIAIVGSGPSLAGHGAEIDEHPVVLRMNKFAPDLNDVDSGTRTDVHVLNHQIDTLHRFKDDPTVLQLDLETVRMATARSYCKRKRLTGKFFDNQVQGKLLMVRPSVVCALPEAAAFTRGFLAYWLVGRLFESADLYGMVETGNGHLGSEKGSIGEGFLDYEHLLYRKIGEILRNGTNLAGNASFMRKLRSAHSHFEMFPWPSA